jgi:hypothetical protein
MTLVIHKLHVKSADIDLLAYFLDYFYYQPIEGVP